MTGRKRERMLVLVAATAVGLLAADRFVLTPLVALWKHQAGRSAVLRQEISEGSVLMDRSAALRDRWKEIRDRSLPGSTADAEDLLLSAVGRWASEEQLQVDSVSPRWILDEKKGNRLEVRLSAKGDLEGIGRFLHRLETDPLPVRLEDVELRPRDDKGEEMTVEARFSGIVLPEEKS